MSVVIKIENVSKQYRPSSIGTNTLKGDLQRWLAFVVAAHLEPVILIVDEVMAIGDTGFQKKWLNLLKNN
jgi:ABC-type oligopeptide transport system ATPase subunit